LDLRRQATGLSENFVREINAVGVESSAARIEGDLPIAVEVGERHHGTAIQNQGAAGIAEIFVARAVRGLYRSGIRPIDEVIRRAIKRTTFRKSSIVSERVLLTSIMH
jgi:hypothetical protein